MIASPRRIPRRQVPPRRRPDSARFTSLSLALPAEPAAAPRRAGSLLALLLVSGMALGGVLGLREGTGPTPSPEEDIFVLEEELPPPPPSPLPPPPMPEPPPPRVEPPPEEPPPPQFGLEEEDLAETGDLAAAAGNTLMKEAESEIAPPPPPLPPAPVFVDQPPRILHGDPPEYPTRALDRGLEGTVVALITIDTTGAVTQVKVEKSAGVDFDQCVLKSARGTRFHPPVRGGRKVPAVFRRPYEFRLE